MSDVGGAWRNFLFKDLTFSPNPKKTRKKALLKPKVQYNLF